MIFTSFISAARAVSDSMTALHMKLILREIIPNPDCMAMGPECTVYGGTVEYVAVDGRSNGANTDCGTQAAHK